MKPCPCRTGLLTALLLAGCSTMQPPAPVENRDHHARPDLVRTTTGSQAPALPTARPRNRQARAGTPSQAPVVVAGPRGPVPETAAPPTPAGPAGRSAAVARENAPEAGPAALALLRQATVYAREGNAGRASSALERALRIEPGNPWLWHRFAVLRLQQRNWAQALELAGKSNALSGDDTRLQAGNWRVIAAAHEGAGHREAAMRARLRVEELEQGLGR